MASQTEPYQSVPSEFSYTETLLACMQERLGLLTALKELANAQVLATDQGEIETTLSLLSRKQSVLDQLAAIQAHLHPYLNDDPEDRKWLSSERRRLCQQVAEQGQQLLQSTLRLEQGVIQELTTRRDAVAAQLRDGRDSILAQTAYMADSSLHSSTLDISDL